MARPLHNNQCQNTAYSAGGYQLQRRSWDVLLLYVTACRPRTEETEILTATERYLFVLRN